jgi:pimeloyl-ACP methyl ester carboxylesterase
MKMAVRLDVGEGRPIVFLHGFPGNGADWEPVAQRLSGSSRVLVLDLLGFGASRRPTEFHDLWVERQAQALAATLDDLGIDRFALVGHDYGGPVALTFLRSQPGRVTHLAIMSTNAFTDTPVDFPLSLLRIPAVGPALDHAFFSTASLAVLGKLASRTRGVRASRNDSSEARTIRTIFGPVLRDLPGLYAEVEASLGEITVPSLVIWGDRDLFFSADQGRRTAEAIPGAEFLLLDGCGHLTPAERPDEVAAALDRLLRRRV